MDGIFLWSGVWLFFSWYELVVFSLTPIFGNRTFFVLFYFHFHFFLASLFVTFFPSILCFVSYVQLNDWNKSKWNNPLAFSSHQNVWYKCWILMILAKTSQYYQPVTNWIVIHSVRGCKIRWLNLCREVRIPTHNNSPGYDIKQSDDEVSFLKLWIM